MSTTALILPRPAARPPSRARLPRWPWVAFLGSLCLTALIAWLHFEQHEAFERQAGQQRHFRLARVDLNRGFRIASLALGPEDPFNRDEGLALIRQAVADFIAIVAHVRPGDGASIAEFQSVASHFEKRLSDWQAGPTPARTAALRIAFGRLERQTALVDAENQRQLDALEASHTRVFLLAVASATVILLGGVGTIFHAARKSSRAEAERQANEQRFRAFFEQVPVALGFVTESGVIAMGNHALTRLLGYVPAEIPTMVEWWEKVYPDPEYRRTARQRWEEAVAGAARAGGPIPPAEFRLCAKDGTIRLVEISGILVAGGVLAVFRDLTDRRRAEEQAAAAHRERERLLAEAEQSRQILLSVVEDQKAAEAALSDREERYRRLVETSFDWVWETDRENRYTYASPRIKELLGYEPAEVLGKTPFDLMPEGEARRINGVFTQIAAQRQPIVGLENINRHKDGRLVVVETNGVPVFAPDGTWSGYQGMDRDITQRRAAEQMLRLRGAALEAAANAVVIITAEGKIEWVNPAFTRLSGWTLEEAVGQSPRQLLDSGQHDDEFFRAIDATVAAGRTWQGEMINRRKDGSLRHEEVSMTPITGPDGVVTHFVAIKQDITERKVTEDRARQAQRMEAIGTLAGGIAHDLNNILTPMLMVAGVIKSKLPDERDQEMIAIIQQGATRGASIIRQLLTFSRGLGGERVQVQARHILREMGDIIRETFPRDIELRLEVSPGLAMIEADPTQIHQLVLNLCVNARDAMPEGGSLRLFAANRTLAATDVLLPKGVKPGGFIVIEVGDTGHGIPPEIKDRIFDPFFTTKPLGKGTGLGLSTVLGIVHGHGGFITVDSSPLQGATFRVYLPAAAAAETAAEKPAPAVQAGQSQLILVVDDEPSIRQVVKLLLTARGYRVLTAVNGRDAVGLFEQHGDEIQLVVTDIMMPSMNGVALVQYLRKSNPRLAIVAMSGMSELPHHEELHRLAVAKILQKPAAEGELLSAIAEALQTPPPGG